MSFPVEGPHAYRAERLWAVYALERGTDQTTPAVSFAIAAVGITYVATTLGFLLTRPAGATLPFVIDMILPIVPITLFTSLVLQNRTTQIRNYYLNALEKELRRLDHIDSARSNEACQRLPAPAFRLWSINTVMAPELRWTTVAAALLHPYTLAAVFVETYTISVLNVFGGWAWYHDLALSIYTLFVVGDVVELIKGRNYLRGRPSERFSSEFTVVDSCVQRLDGRVVVSQPPRH